MTWLRDFFKNKNLEKKFSRLGEGHRLNEVDNRNQYVPTPSTSAAKVPGAESSKAAEAAMERFNKQHKKPETAASREVKRELAAERLQAEEARELQERLTQRVIIVERPSVLSRVLFWCPLLLGESVIGPHDEVDTAIQQRLATEAATNPTEVAALMLSRGLQLAKPPAASPDTPISEQPTLREWREKQRQQFVRVLDNLIREPDKDSFRRLRASNRLVQQLLAIDGAAAFLKACNFNEKSVPSNAPPTNAQDESPSGVEGLVSPDLEVHWSISEADAKSTEHLEKMRDLLMTAEPILPELYRDTKVFQATGNVSVSLSRDQLPDEFFCHSKEEVKRLLEQQQRIIAESGMLLTKAMRDRLKVQEIRLFRFALLRVRLPGNLIIQGTFYATDSLISVRTWVSECLANPTTEYQLLSPPGVVNLNKPNVPPTARVELTDDSATITELGLAPCSLLSFVLSGQAQSSKQDDIHLLRPDLIAQITDLPTDT